MIGVAMRDVQYGPHSLPVFHHVSKRSDVRRHVLGASINTALRSPTISVEVVGEKVPRALSNSWAWLV